MSTITRPALKQLRLEMQAAFDKAGMAGFELEVGNMRFSTDTVTIKVEGKLAGAVTKVDKTFEAKVKEHGLKMVGAKGQQLVGYKASRPKYPFSYKTIRGTGYKATVAQAKAIFG